MLKRMTGDCTMTLRDYQPEDLASVVALFTASVHQLAGRYYSPAQCEAWAPSSPDLSQWATRLAGLKVIVADGAIGTLGFIGYTTAGHIDLLFTSPLRPRSGVATRLYHAAQADLIRCGTSVAYTEASLAAEPFFVRQGFATVETQDARRGDEMLRRLLMRKTLALAASD